MSDVKETVFEHDVHDVPSTGSTLSTFAVLLLLAVVAIGVGFSNVGPLKVVASLLITCVQVAVLSVYFMELRQADKLTWLCAGAAVFWTMIMFTFIMTDYLTRQYGAF